MDKGCYVTYDFCQVIEELPVKHCQVVFQPIMEFNDARLRVRVVIQHALKQLA